MSKPVILTGLRANNDLTLGNYLGALLPLVDMAKTRSDEYAIHLFVPDLHSFTTPIEHGSLYEQTLANLRVYVAAGLPLDNPNVHIYRQSYIPAHSELTWILDCFTSLGQLNRMTQFKEKAKIQDFDEALQRLHKQAQASTPDASQLLKHIETLWTANSQEASASAGLYTYPVLMAADILLYDAVYVPVGDDQTQHLEFTRDIAQRMNNKFGPLFTMPYPVPKQHEFFGKEQGLRIRDLQHPTKKMSKSDESGKGVIFLSDDPDAAAKKIMSATTDSVGKIHYDMQQQPGIGNLLQILALLSGQTLDDTKAAWEGKSGYGELKKALAARVEAFLIDFQQRVGAVNMATVQAKLVSDEAKMNDIANQTLLRVQRAVGLRPNG